MKVTVNLLKLGVLVVGMFVPVVCFGLATGEEGNRKLAAANYTDWPGLVDAINDASRVGQFWVNGSEWFSYSGDVVALNRVLKEFGETEVEELVVVLRPGTGRTAKVAEKEHVIDWELSIVGGIAREHYEKAGSLLRFRLVPTLGVNVSERIDLAKLVMPEGVKVLTWDDVRARTEGLVKSEVESAAKEGGAELKRMEGEVKGEGFGKRLEAIRSWVAGRNG